MRLLLAVLWLVMLVMPAAAGSSIYMLGSTKVELNEYTHGSGFTYFAPHSNETTAVAVAKALVKKSGGRVLWLTHGDGGRNITFVLKGVTYTVDPNRIFSDTGAQASLKPSSPEALMAVRGLARFIIAALFTPAPSHYTVVGIHNNTNGNLSVESYARGANAREAQAVYVGAGDADDFFFVTRGDFFEFFKTKGFNVVLQAWPLPDDGSLSVYCERHGLPYINVEAQQGHGAQQRAMLEALKLL